MTVLSTHRDNANGGGGALARGTTPLTTSSRELRAYGAVAVAILVLLLAFTGTDRSVSAAVADQGSVFGTVLQTFGEFPPALAAAVATQMIAAWLVLSSRERSRAQRTGIIVGVFFLGLAGFLSLLNWSSGMISYLRMWRFNAAAGLPIGAANNDSSISAGWSLFFPSCVIALLVLVLVAVAVAAAERRSSVATRRGSLVVALISLAVVWAGQAVNSGLKTVWGRFRPYEVAAGEGPFTSWLHPNWPNGHYSFPSGHTHEATMLAVFAILLLPFGFRWAQRLLWIGAAYGVVMGVSRVMVGAHWPTDTVVSFGLTFGLVVVGWSLARRMLAGIGQYDGCGQESSTATVRQAVRITNDR